MITRRETSTDRLICRACKKVVEPGEGLVVFIYDNNPVGTGPVEHIECYTKVEWRA